MALLSPHLAQKSQKVADATMYVPAVAEEDDALSAPKTAFLTLEEYAEQAAQEAGVDPVRFQRLIRCESRWKEDAAGDNGTSFGILQFKKPTFELFLKKYPIPDADMDNPRHQIDLAAAMISNGYLGHWKNCSRKIGWSTER